MRASGEFQAITSHAPPNAYAFFSESLEDEHQVSVLRGVLAAAREVDATILCIAAGNIDDPNPARRAWNFAFDIPTPSNVRGILLMSSAMGNALGPDGLARWLERFGEMPSTCVGVAVPDRPSVEVDNAAGMRALVLHLVREHRARELGFVRGPEASVEAELRLSAFRDALREDGLELDEQAIAQGDYSKESGAHAVRAILDARRPHAPRLDALVCANDFMALGAIAELGRRGYHVPEDLAVVGFDDVDSARLVHPPLTTVRQPGEELGRSGLRRLVAQAAKRDAPLHALLPTELVVRRSCGCLPTELARGTHGSISPGRAVEASFVQRRQIILAEVVRASQGKFGAAGSAWEARLLDALTGEIRSGEAGSFLRAVEHCLRRLEHSGADVSPIQDVLTALRRQSLPCVDSDAIARNRLEQALHDARAAASAFATQVDAARVRAAVERFRRFERRARSAMIDAPESLSTVAAEELPALGIEACVVAVVDPSPGPSAATRVLFGFGRGGGAAAHTGPLSLELLPLHPLLERASRVLVVLPIALGAKPLGVAIVSVTRVDGTLLEDLRDFLATVLAVSTLVRA